MLHLPTPDGAPGGARLYSRRDLLARLAMGGAAGVAAQFLWPTLAGQAFAAAAPGRVRRKQLVIVWLDGGPSHFETFDPKPGTPTGGPFAALDTGIGDWRFSENLPGLAKLAPHLSIVRSLTSKESSHGRARDLLHFGYRPNPSVDYPTLGAIAALEIGDFAADLPPFVQIGGTPASPGHLPAECAPFYIGDGREEVANLECCDAPRDAAATERRERLRAAIDAEFRERGGARTVDLFETRRRSARRLMDSPLKATFDLSQESKAVQRRYGQRSFGAAMLMARRLIEAGVAAVEVELPGWDTHGDNFPRQKQLCGSLDPALCALIEDLIERGLWESTVVVCLGEFSRTPTINGNGGRDHWPNNFCALLGGGGIRPGVVVGRTDERGESIVERPVQVADLFATFATLLGFDRDKEFNPTTRRPTKLIDPDGAPIAELLG